MRSWRSLALGLCGGVGALALAGMMLLTVADVALRAFFNWPIRGTLEVIELLLAITFFVALPAAFLRGENIVVDVIDRMMPRGVNVLRRLAEMLGVGIIVLMAWQGWKAAQDTLVFGDVTADIELPRIWYWIPVLVGLIGSGVTALVMAIRPGSDK